MDWSGRDQNSIDRDQEQLTVREHSHYFIACHHNVVVASTLSTDVYHGSLSVRIRGGRDCIPAPHGATHLGSLIRTCWDT